MSRSPSAFRITALAKICRSLLAIKTVQRKHPAGGIRASVDSRSFVRG